MGLSAGENNYSYAPNVWDWIDPMGLMSCPNYGELDDLGRPAGVSATITSDMIGTGSSAKRSIKPLCDVLKAGEAKNLPRAAMRLGAVLSRNQ